MEYKIWIISDILLFKDKKALLCNKIFVNASIIVFYSLFRDILIVDDDIFNHEAIDMILN